MKYVCMRVVFLLLLPHILDARAGTKKNVNSTGQGNREIFFKKGGENHAAPFFDKDAGIKEDLQSDNALSFEKTLSMVSLMCGASTLISSVMYINNWGNMRRKVKQSHLGERGFKFLSGPLFLASCFVLYKQWVGSKKNLSKAIQANDLKTQC